MATPAEQADAILAAADRHERRLGKALRSTFDGFQDRFPTSEVAGLIEAHRGISVDMIPWNELFVMPTFKSGAALAGDDLQAELIATMVDAARTVGIDGSSFTLTNPYAIRAARTMAADLIAREKRVTREAVKRVIVAAMRGNLTGAEAARLISRSIGLDGRSATALANYANQLALVEAGQAGASTLGRVGFAAPKTASGRASAVERYAKRLRKARAEMIARTEIMKAANRGLTLSWEQAARDGLINTAHARKQWISTSDTRSCDTCIGYDGKIVGFYDDFGMALPAHPSCRCTQILIT